MFVLGIDPGLSTTGYGIVSTGGTRPRAVAAGVIRTDPAAETASRLMELAADLEGVLRDHDVGAGAEAAVEEVFVNRNLNTATSVARASGVVLLTLARAGLSVTEYTPSAVKTALCGYGRAPKDQVQKVVAMRLGLDTPPSPADAADALAIAMCHLQGRRFRLAAGDGR